MKRLRSERCSYYKLLHPQIVLTLVSCQTNTNTLDKSGELRPQAESHILETCFKSSRDVRCVLHGDNLWLQARCIFIELTPPTTQSSSWKFWKLQPFCSVLCCSVTIDVCWAQQSAQLRLCCVWKWLYLAQSVPDSLSVCALLTVSCKGWRESRKALTSSPPHHPNIHTSDTL